MKELHDRIAEIIDSPEFELALERHGEDLSTFQCTWARISAGVFSELSEGSRKAILEAENTLRQISLSRLVSA